MNKLAILLYAVLIVGVVSCDGEAVAVAPTTVPTPTPTPTPCVSVVSSIDRDCCHFKTWEDAQCFYEANGPGDPHWLDADGNGIACEALRYGMPVRCY